MKIRILFWLFVSVPLFSQNTITWDEKSSGVVPTLWSVHFADSIHGWAVGDVGSLVRTTDGGENWSKISFDISDSLRAVYFISPEKGWVAGNKGIIYQSTDSGLTWNNVYENSISYLTDAWFVNDQVGFFTGQKSGGIVVRTDDGGQSWNVISVSGTSSLGSISFINENTGWVGGRDEVSMTVDGGLTWSTPVTPEGDSYKSYINTIWFSDSTSGFASGRYGGITKSVDGGQTWTFYDSSLSEWIEDIYFPENDLGFMVGERGLIRVSENAGATWQDTYPRHPSSLWAPWFRSVHFTSPSNGWVVGDSGIIMQGTVSKPSHVYEVGKDKSIIDILRISNNEIKIKLGRNQYSKNVIPLVYNIKGEDVPYSIINMGFGEFHIKFLTGKTPSLYILYMELKSGSTLIRPISSL